MSIRQMDACLAAVAKRRKLDLRDLAFAVRVGFGSDDKSYQGFVETMESDDG